jgi:hypothetical protein
MHRTGREKKAQHLCRPETAKLVDLAAPWVRWVSGFPVFASLPHKSLSLSPATSTLCKITFPSEITPSKTYLETLDDEELTVGRQRNRNRRVKDSHSTKSTMPPERVMRLAHRDHIAHLETSQAVSPPHGGLRCGPSCSRLKVC